MQPSSQTILTSFLEYLREQELYQLLPDISKELAAQVLKDQNVIVVSALPLSGDEQARVKELASSKWGEHAVLFNVDETLLSGLILKFQDTVIDLSGRHQLSDLSQNLRA